MESFRVPNMRLQPSLSPPRREHVKDGPDPPGETSDAAAASGRGEFQTGPGCNAQSRDPLARVASGGCGAAVDGVCWLLSRAGRPFPAAAEASVARGVRRPCVSFGGTCQRARKCPDASRTAAGAGRRAAGRYVRRLPVPAGESEAASHCGSLRDVACASAGFDAAGRHQRNGSRRRGKLALCDPVFVRCRPEWESGRR